MKLLNGPGKVYNYFMGGYHHPPKRIAQKFKIDHPPNFFDDL